MNLIWIIFALYYWTVSSLHGWHAVSFAHWQIKGHLSLISAVSNAKVHRWIVIMKKYIFATLVLFHVLSRKTLLLTNFPKALRKLQNVLTKVTTLLHLYRLTSVVRATFHYERSPPWSEKVVQNIEPSMQTCGPSVHNGKRSSKWESHLTNTSYGNQSVVASPVLYTLQWHREGLAWKQTTLFYTNEQTHLQINSQVNIHQLIQVLVAH